MSLPVEEPPILPDDEFPEYVTPVRIKSMLNLVPREQASLHTYQPARPIEPWKLKFGETGYEATDFTGVPNSDLYKPNPVKLLFQASQKYDLIEVGGTFNDWNFFAMTLHSASKGKYLYSAKLHELAAGSYQYKYRIDGEKYVCDESKPTGFDTDGNLNNTLVVEHPEKIDEDFDEECDDEDNDEDDLLHLKPPSAGRLSKEKSKGLVSDSSLRLKSSSHDTDQPDTLNDQERAEKEARLQSEKEIIAQLKKKHASALNPRKPIPPAGTFGPFYDGAFDVEEEEDDDDENTREVNRQATILDLDVEMPRSAHESLLRPVSSTSRDPSPFALPEAAYETELAAVWAQQAKEKENAKLAISSITETKISGKTLSSSTEDDEKETLATKRTSLNATKAEKKEPLILKTSSSITTKDDNKDPFIPTGISINSDEDEQMLLIPKEAPIKSRKDDEKKPVTPKKTSSKLDNDVMGPFLQKGPISSTKSVKLHEGAPDEEPHLNDPSPSVDATLDGTVASYDGCFDQATDEEDAQEMRPTSSKKKQRQQEQPPRANENVVEPFPHADGAMEMTVEEYAAQLEAELIKEQKVSWFAKIFLCGAGRKISTNF